MVRAAATRAGTLLSTWLSQYLAIEYHWRQPFAKFFGGAFSASALFSKPDSNCDSVTPSALDIRARFVKLTLLSPRSTAPIHVR